MRISDQSPFIGDLGLGVRPGALREGPASGGATTMAVGEEGGGATTMAVGEESNSGTPAAIGDAGGGDLGGGVTSLYVGEEGGGDLGGGVTSLYVGEEGGGDLGGGVTSLYVGEEGGGEVTPTAPGEDGGAGPGLADCIGETEQLLQLFIREFGR